MGIADDGPDSLAQLFSERGIAPCGSTAWWKGKSHLRDKPNGLGFLDVY